MTRRPPFGLGWLAILLGRERSETDAPRRIVSAADVQLAAARLAEQSETRTQEESRRLAPILSGILRATGRSITAGTTTREVYDHLVDHRPGRGARRSALTYPRRQSGRELHAQ
jgi:hypothetical protein